MTIAHFQHEIFNLINNNDDSLFFAQQIFRFEFCEINWHLFKLFVSNRLLVEITNKQNKIVKSAKFSLWRRWSYLKFFIMRKFSTIEINDRKFSCWKITNRRIREWNNIQHLHEIKILLLRDHESSYSWVVCELHKD